MMRIEIIANHSVEENILEAMRREGVGKFYTKYPGVYGVGAAGPRMGDAIWPEENFALVIWCEEDEARGIERAVADVKSHFPGEGIKLFGLHDERREGSAPTDAARSPDTAQIVSFSEETPPRKPPALPEDGPEDPNAE
jgi:hypothetical protein